MLQFLLVIPFLLLLVHDVNAQQRDKQQTSSEKSSTSEIASQLKEFSGELESERTNLIDFRRDLHRHPEVSGEEKRTAGAISKHLKALGLEVRTNVGGYGVVAYLEGNAPGPVVAFRADIDAVYSNQPDPVEFASEIPGVRHICGHDIHTTVGIALAEGFVRIKEELAGSILFVFQPAEERVLGARAMIDDGALEEYRPDAIFSYHTSPLEVGQIGTKSGVMLAGRDRLTVTLSSKNDLATVAERAQKMIRSIQTVTPGVNSIEGDFITLNIFNSERVNGRKSWRIQASLSTTSQQIRQQAQDELRSKLDALRLEGVMYEMTYQERVAGGVNNDAGLEAASHHSLRSVIGDDNLVLIKEVPVGFSEDFGFFQDEIPGVMYFLGVSNKEKGWIGMPHSPQYVADEESIFVGARAMAAIMLDFMAAQR